MGELRVNNKLWLISDTHFGHQNIVKFQQRPVNHELIMCSEWIWRVQEHHQVLHLGDVCVGKAGNPHRWAAVISRLPGEKFLILGNHDRQKRSFYEEECGFTIVDHFVVNGFAFTHRPISADYPYPELKDWHTNIHGHTHSNVFKPEHDGLTYPGKRYINVCVEHTGLAPVQLGQIWN